MATDPAPDAARSYDVYLTDGAARLRWSIADHGVTLRGDGLSWTCDGAAHDHPFSDIDEVHLQSGAIGDQVVHSCRLVFRDGDVVSISDGGGQGLGEAGQAGLYRGFVADLHGKLAALPASGIRFTCGFGEARYRMGIVLMWVVGAFFVVMPTVLVLATGAWGKVGLLYAGLLFLLPIYKIAQANRPRDYDPRWPPEELVGEAPAEGPRGWLSWVQS